MTLENPGGPPDHHRMSAIFSGEFPARVKAVLGPTNTGKTHLAIERMLAHASGIIGFPLRLLARENYERMVARKGAAHVALITGEEKIVPPGAKWFSCTTEAMPLDHPAEFVAVDEIQLCADPDRGHVFTDRLLHARGLVETMFLGAETIRPLLQHLIPPVEIETRPRLSQLSHTGATKLARLPPRSAVVAFSAAEVYAIAELIRRRRGGCAVVMGRLSPRTRNAQVALYQEKEVDFLVATDAIGMGLNMDVDHVAFAGLGKFDGHRPRPLDAAEVAQIAGRAGRGMRDGTFGTTASCPALDPAIAGAVEAHSFERLEVLYWRNSELDFTSPEGLLAALARPPSRAGLVRGAESSDVTVLAALVRESEIRDLARGRRRVRQLWDACQIPDFRKLGDESHARLCGQVFVHLARQGHLPTGWLGPQIAGLDRTDGDIDTLMQRLAGVRVWSYIAARADWLEDAAFWQGEARHVEEKLSDALHESLTARFVDRRAARIMRRLESGERADLLSAVTRRGEVVVEGQAVGHIEGFGFVPDPLSEGEERRLVLRAARRSLLAEMPGRLVRLEAEPDSGLAWRPDQYLTWAGAAVGRLRPGARALQPRVEALDSEFLDGPARERVRVRLQRFLDTEIAAGLAPLFAAMARADGAGDLRGPLHRLAEGLGVVAGATEESIAPELRARLKALGVRAGRFALYLPALLKPRPAALRARLWAAQHRMKLPELPEPGQVSLAPRPDWPAGFAEAMGWVEAGPVLLRLDIAERVAADLAHAARRHPVVLPAEAMARLAVAPAQIPEVLRGLGLAVLPAGAPDPELFGPPMPLRAALRRGPGRGVSPRPVRRRTSPDHPFAALAVLRP